MADEQGLGGVVVRVSLTYDHPAPDAPPSVVIKFATPHAPTRAVMQRFGFYRAEVEFYRQLSATAGISTPVCYFADLDADGDFSVVVLEDLSSARLGSLRQTSLDDLRVAVRHLARFHARWWASPRLRTLDWLVFPEGDDYRRRAMRLEAPFRDAMVIARHDLGSHFPPAVTDAAAGMLADWPGFIASRQTDCPTLIHRDFHPQQMFFPANGAGRFAVFDWQTVGIGRGAEDLARIVSVGLDSHATSAGFELIECYHAELVASGVTSYGAERCYADFRHALTSSLITAVMSYSLNRSTSLSSASMIFGRLGAAFETHGAVAQPNGWA